MALAYFNLWALASEKDSVNDLIAACYNRLNDVERKHIFADQLQTEMLTLINEHRKRNGHGPLTAAAAYMGALPEPRSSRGGGILASG
ncbi:hypothetical protein D3C75_1263540 [compost metagenome]